MNLFQKQQNTSRYTSIPDGSAADDETAVVPRGTPQSTTTMTMDRRSPTLIMVAIVAFMMMMLVVTGGSVWMLQTTDGGLSTTAVERNKDNSYRCCKDNSSADCKMVYIGFGLTGTRKCVADHGYGGHCHRGAGIGGANCCNDKDQGTWYAIAGCV